MKKKWLVTMVVIAVGCGNSDLPGPVEWNRPVVRTSELEAYGKRMHCGFEKGSLAAETHGTSYPAGRDIPIDYIFVIMLENRSFDHVFQKLNLAGPTDSDVAPDSYANPDAEGKPHKPARDTDYCHIDLAHEWNEVHHQYNNGKMDGFYQTSQGYHELALNQIPAEKREQMLSGQRALNYYEPSDLPLMTWAANEFAMGDRYFSSVLAGTWPNRMFFYAGTSRGIIRNHFLDAPEEEDVVIFDLLERRKVDWAIYKYSIPGLAVIPSQAIKYFRPANRNNVRDTTAFLTDIQKEGMPPVVYIDPFLNNFDDPAGSNDQHPPAMIQSGEQWLAQVLDGIMKSRYWSRSAIFVTYDEHGGYYDHVTPPKACAPDEYAPKYEAGDVPGDFAQLGVRVPFLVISPYAKKHYVSHRVYDHTSIMRFVEAKFVLPAFTRRDANAEIPWDLFDFESPPHLAAATIPTPTMDNNRLTTCRSYFNPLPTK